MPTNPRDHVFPASTKDWSTADYAIELLIEHTIAAEKGSGNDPHRAAFVDACNARGTDARTKQFKHYDRIVKWMIANWPELG